MGMEWGCHRLQACALPPPPRGGRWKPRRSVPGVARGAGQRGRAAGRRQAAGGEEPATLLLSAEATGNRGRPTKFILPFKFLPTAARSPHGSGQVARGRRGPEAACPAHPVTPALQDAAAGAARRTAYRSEEAAARLGFFPSAFPQPTDTRHRRHNGGRSCRERRHGAQRRRRPYVGRLERAPLLAEDPP